MRGKLGAHAPGHSVCTVIFLCIGIKDLLYEVVPGSNVRMFSRMRPDGPDGNEMETLK